MLLVLGSLDVFNIDITCPESISNKGQNAILEFYYTLLEIFDQGILLTYNLTDDEISGFVNPNKDDPDSPNKSLIIYETDEGGTGVIKSLLNNPIRWKTFISKITGLIHLKPVFPYEETDDACNKACYNCLLGYWNQKHHYFLNRMRVLDYVKLLIDSLIFEGMDYKENNENQLEELMDGGLDSELEKRVLLKMKEMNIPLPDKVQFMINDHNRVPITKADYYYVNRRLAVFVDGPPHNPELYPDNAEKDNNKRRQIKRFGYEVYIMNFYSNISDNGIITDERIKDEIIKFKEVF